MPIVNRLFQVHRLPEEHQCLLLAGLCTRPAVDIRMKDNLSGAGLPASRRALVLVHIWTLDRCFKPGDLPEHEPHLQAGPATKMGSGAAMMHHDAAHGNRHSMEPIDGENAATEAPTQPLQQKEQSKQAQTGITASSGYATRQPEAPIIQTVKQGHQEVEAINQPVCGSVEKAKEHECITVQIPQPGTGSQVGSRSGCLVLPRVCSQQAGLLLRVLSS
jgi:hypothetical protein